MKILFGAVAVLVLSLAKAATIETLRGKNSPHLAEGASWGSNTKENGAICAFDNECLTGRCSMRFRCADLLVDGETCGEDEDCNSGFCKRNGFALQKLCTGKNSTIGSEQCGGEEACVPSRGVRDHGALSRCLGEAVADPETLLTIFANAAEIKRVKKLTYPQDGQDFVDARYNGGYGVRWPAVIVYAENVEEVQAVVSCAVAAGYKISPRGRGHHYQGYSTMDGYVVLDMSMFCTPDEFVVDRTEGDWLLPGQKTLGSVTAGAGCTNAAMLGWAHKTFTPEEGGLYAIGTCPSVGITGYSTGGGVGDVSPYVGWGVDDILSVEMVLYDGSVVNASKDENADLFWAVQGGGSGYGVITSMETVVVQSPEPPKGEDRQFCYFYLEYLYVDDASRKRFLRAFQDFLYDNPQSIRLGGQGVLMEQIQIVRGIWLGSKEEFTNILSGAGLLDTAFLNAHYPASYSTNYETVATPEGMPDFGIKIDEFNSYGESMIFKICSDYEMDPILRQGPLFAMLMTASSGDWCADLGISPDKCYAQPVEQLGGYPIQFPHCLDPEVIGAIADAAYDPASFFNRPGTIRTVGTSVPTATGGILIPRLDVDVLNDLVKVGLQINHLQHGAPLSRSTKETAWAQRDTALLAWVNIEQHEAMSQILVDRHYGDASKLQGYYNYMNPPGNPHWRQYYFGDNYERLSEIKAEFDPLNVFGNPMQVEPGARKSTHKPVTKPPSPRKHSSKPMTKTRSPSSKWTSPPASLWSESVIPPALLVENHSRAQK